jgi:hypothetical protein
MGVNALTWNFKGLQRIQATETRHDPNNGRNDPK